MNLLFSHWEYERERQRQRVLPVRCSNKIDCINCCEWRYNKIVHTECYCCTWCTRSLADYYTCHSWRIGWRIAWDVFVRSAHNLSRFVSVRTMHSQNQELRSGLRKLTGNLNVAKTNFHIIPSQSFAHFALFSLFECSVYLRRWFVVHSLFACHCFFIIWLSFLAPLRGRALYKVTPIWFICFAQWCTHK